MTVSFDQNSHTVRVEHGARVMDMPAAEFAALAAANSWGDVANLLEAAKQNPSIAIDVPNVGRKLKARNYGAMGVRQ